MRLSRIHKMLQSMQACLYAVHCKLREVGNCAAWLKSPHFFADAEHINQSRADLINGHLCMHGQQLRESNEHFCIAHCCNLQQTLVPLLVLLCLLTCSTEGC